MVSFVFGRGQLFALKEILLFQWRPFIHMLIHVVSRKRGRSLHCQKGGSIFKETCPVLPCFYLWAIRMKEIVVTFLNMVTVEQKGGNVQILICASIASWKWKHSSLPAQHFYSRSMDVGWEGSNHTQTGLFWHVSDRLVSTKALWATVVVAINCGWFSHHCVQS